MIKLIMKIIDLLRSYQFLTNWTKKKKTFKKLFHILLPHLIYTYIYILLCVLVGRKLGLWVKGIVGLIFFGLCNECILRAFFSSI